MVSLGEGVVRGIKELRYIRGGENWIADASSRLGLRDKQEPRVDSTAKKRLDFFFCKGEKVSYRRGK